MKKWARRRLAGEEGLSLVEVLVAVVILGFILAGFAATLVATLHSLLANESRVRANALANEVLEDLQQVDWGQLAEAVEDDTVEDLLIDSFGYPAAWTFERDGVGYDVDIAIIWVDDDATPLNDKDYLELTVTIDWDDLGRARTVTHHGHRAPTADEIDPGPAVRSVRADPEIGYLVWSPADQIHGKLDEKVHFDADDEPDTENIHSSHGVGLTLLTTEPVTSVDVSFEDRDGITQTASLEAQDPDNKEWWLNHAGADSPSWRYRSGDTTFDFDISSPEGGFSARKVVRYVFAPADVDVDGPHADPETVCVDEDFNGEHDVVLTAEFFGLTVDDTVEVTGAELDPDEELFAEHTDDTMNGSEYEFVLAEGHPYPVEETATVTMTGVRAFDDASAQGSTDLTIIDPQHDDYEDECQ